MTKKYSNVYINDKYSILSSIKYNPIVKNNVNKIIDDYYLNQKTVELAEAKLQELTIKSIINNNKKHNISLLIGGDLQNQILASTLGSVKFKIPHLGIYSACATFVEGLIIASNFVSDNSVVVTTSSHNLVSEKQFRFPVEYGALRKRVNNSTASGSISILISNKKSNIKVESSTIGKVIKTNHKDANDMGAAMAPAAALTLKKHLDDTKRDVDYYDLILTGDLGVYGSKIMKKYFEKISNKKINNMLDSGSLFYTEDNIYA